jgi:hypothetical protein
MKTPIFGVPVPLNATCLEKLFPMFMIGFCENAW